MNELQPFLDLLSGKMPWLIPMLAFIGAVRLPMKIFNGWFQRTLTAFVDRVAASPQVDDDEYLLRIFGSIWYRFLAFLLDAVFSLKLPTTESLQKQRDQEDEQDGSGPKPGAFAGTLSLWLLLSGLTVCGCAQLQPGADPLIVRTEQVEQGAKATFQLTLQLDNLDRGFWRTNAPAFHDYCELLRIPTPYQVTNTLPRYRVMLLTLNDVKMDYRAFRTAARSNDLVLALATLQNLQDQAHAWLTIVTNRASASGTGQLMN
jgi:hypothetical protein